MAGNDRDQILSTDGAGEVFTDVMERRLSRRDFLKGAVTASAVVVGAAALGAPERAAAQDTKFALTFKPVGPSKGLPDPLLADGYTEAILLSWGDPILPDAPAFDPANLSAAAQSKQFGYNNDYVGFLPVPFGSGRADLGLLVVNHEYTNEELMFPNWTPETTTKEIVDIALAAHGMSIVQVRNVDGRWVYDRDAGANRRITGTTPIAITGPAAGADWLKTRDDPTGTRVLGTLNNCAGGITPWGTVVSGEENFNQYFGNAKFLKDDDPRKAVHKRYGIPTDASERRWEDFYRRFNVPDEPNEPFRFGWAVEVDPYDPGSTPKKRTALGRTKHEAVTFVVAPGGQVVGYMGDDERFDYVYKFVTAGRYNPADRAANMDLLDAGTLYVAVFRDDGTGEWRPLVFGQGPLTPENGFTSQADVLIKTRLAADKLGATKMDRPEDVEVNPVNRKVYAVMTNNTQRGAAGRPGTDRANPRANNRSGHIIEITEANNDHAATTFTWDIFLLAGDPADESTYFAGYPKDRVSPIAAPDNVAFDRAGHLWIATDGQFSALKNNDGFYAVPVEGSERGYLRQFYATVPGAEICGPEFTPDNTTVFLAIQHPGEGGTYAEPLSTWPGTAPIPRPSVIAIQAAAGGRIGSAGAGSAAPAAPGGRPAAGSAPTPATLPRTGGEALPGAWVAAAGLAAAAAGALLRRLHRASPSADDPADKQQDNA
jgi:secreted PhoX family phosphatase